MQVTIVLVWFIWDFHTNAIITIISIELKSLCNQNDCF